MNPEFSELHAFVVLAGELHFRKASERLFLSQPGTQQEDSKTGGEGKGSSLRALPPESGPDGCGQEFPSESRKTVAGRRGCFTRNTGDR